LATSTPVTRSEDDQDDGTQPMLITATVGSEIVNSLTVRSDPEDDTNKENRNPIYMYGPEARTNSSVPTLRLEMDPAFPPRLVRNVYANRLTASCRFRIYSSSGVTLKSTGSNPRPTAYNLSLNVKEALVFSNSAIQSLKYQPAIGGVSFDPVGDFADQWGESFSPTFIGPGRQIETVVWVNSTTYESPKSKTLGPFDVAAVNISRKATPCWGAVEATYSTVYDQYEYEFEMAQSSNGLRAFMDAYIFAIYDGKIAGQLQLQAPAMRGKR